jgi:hypothetical protein
MGKVVLLGRETSLVREYKITRFLILQFEFSYFLVGNMGGEGGQSNDSYNADKKIS